MDISKLDPGNVSRLNVFVECPKESKHFCEYDLKKEIFVFKKLLEVPFPGCYGFVPKTHHIDAEPLDVLVLSSEPLEKGIILQARPIGMVRLKNKIPDEILIAVSLSDKEYKDIENITNLSENNLYEIKQFLEEFKNMEVENVFDAEYAKRAVERAIELYKRVG